MTGAHIIPSAWYFNVKRFPDFRLWDFNDIFYTRGDIQVKVLYYFEKYAPVASWNTARLMLRLSTNQGRDTRQADFSNDFV